MADNMFPVIDMAAYQADTDSEASKNVIQEIHKAASTWGFFVLKNTPVAASRQLALLNSAKEFFALPIEEKLALDVAQGGIAWRGYMPLGGEHTHGSQDWKEGLYVGPEHPDDHPLSGLPLHGHNQFPDVALPEFRPNALAYLEQVTELGKTLTNILSAGLGLDKTELQQRWLRPEPIVLFRCFKYVPNSPTDSKENGGFGIGEHTDFGYLTILKVDSPGLQVLSPTDNWVDVPVVENALIINVGDMLDRLTHGRFCSRPHRVQRPGPGLPSRFSFPLFFDFAWDTTMERLPLDHLPSLTEDQEERARNRWAKTTFREVDGKWSQYLARKVQKIFPNLQLPDFEPNAAPSTRFTRVVNVGSVPS